MITTRINAGDATFYVVGNGPSLTTSILDRLPPGRWLGMNSAFRYWNETNNYPRYYACLDPVVLKSQLSGILSLMRSSPIQHYFLHDVILECEPSLKSDPRITLLSQFLNRESKVVPISRLGAIKQTTGALATRFVIEQGERQLMLLGIDCNYVEVIAEAKHEAGNELVIQKAVTSNPNYFFAGYQDVGDHYQIPNPKVHSGNLHLQSFIALRDDVELAAAPIDICTGSTYSQLSRYGIFPCRDFWATTGTRRLQCIAVPLTRGEVDLFIMNLSLWLDPRLKPTMNPMRKGVVLHIFFDFAEDEKITEMFRTFFQNNDELYSYFDEVRITFFNFPPAINYYIKKMVVSEPVFCTKSGPNVFFLSVMAQCAGYEFTMQMESDCVPIRSGWLDAAENEIASGGGGEAWIVGPGYMGPTRLHSSYRLHINGNAIYHTGSREFQQFLVDDFMPLLQGLITDGVADLAYDTALSLAYLNFELLPLPLQKTLSKLLPKWRHSNLILNAGGRIENEANNNEDVMPLIRQNSDAFLLHGRRATEKLRASIGELDSYFSVAEGIVKRELAFGFIWCDSDGLNELTYKGFGKALVAGSPSKPIASVVLHFRVPRASVIKGTEFEFTAILIGSVQKISSVEILVKDGGNASALLSCDQELKNVGDEVHMRVRATTLLDFENAVFVAIKLLIENGREDKSQVLLEFSNIFCVEQCKSTQSRSSIQVIKPADAVLDVIQNWSSFISESGVNSRVWR